MNSKPNILVLGGAGYIGSILIPSLLEKNYAVTVVDNFMYKQTSLAHVCYHPNFTLLRADFRNFSIYESELKKADIIIPLAAIVGAPACKANPIEAKSINHTAILDLFGKISKSQWILMPTTNSAYGGGTTGKFCDETSPLEPISEYAKDKVAIEQALLEKENVISFRLATVFGMSPRMRLDLLVNDFTYRAITDRYLVLFESNFQRNYIHIRDVANVFLHGIENFYQLRSQIYNVGLSSANLTKAELCKEIQKEISDFIFFESTLGKDPDQRNYSVSNAKIERTGFQAQFSLSFGIKELIKGFQMLRTSNYSNI